MQRSSLSTVVDAFSLINNVLHKSAKLFTVIFITKLFISGVFAADLGPRSSAAWKRSSDPWKRSPDAWKRSSDTWTRSSDAWKRSSDAWKRSSDAWKRSSSIGNDSAMLLDSEPGYLWSENYQTSKLTTNS